jgi:NAD dependent epimerase/dehydratase family enzyme
VRITVTGATGLIGPRLVASLRARGDEVTVLSRDPDRARERLEDPSSASASSDDPRGALQTVRWNLLGEPAPAAALAGRDAIVHLAGENVAQRWSTSAKQAIRDSRISGTKHLVRGVAALDAPERPRTLVSSSAIGYYGAHGDEPIDEEAPAGDGFLARTCRDWELEALEAEALPIAGTPPGAHPKGHTLAGIPWRAQTGGQAGGLRVVSVRTGVVLEHSGGALGKMLPPFKLGIGGPVAGGHQFVSWIHVEDVVGIVLAAIDDEHWHGPINATAPEPQRNRDFSKALGRALHRPSLLPVPGAALRLLYGEMAEIVTSGARVLPAKALVLGYRFRHPQLDAALRAALDTD